MVGAPNDVDNHNSIEGAAHEGEERQFMETEEKAENHHKTLQELVEGDPGSGEAVRGYSMQNRTIIYSMLRESRSYNIIQLVPPS